MDAEPGPSTRACRIDPVPPRRRAQAPSPPPPPTPSTRLHRSPASDAIVRTCLGLPSYSPIPKTPAAYAILLSFFAVDAPLSLPVATGARDSVPALRAESPLNDGAGSAHRRAVGENEAEELGEGGMVWTQDGGRNGGGDDDGDGAHDGADVQPVASMAMDVDETEEEEEENEGEELDEVADSLEGLELCDEAMQW
ncbi:hypothetical protein EXIGLDRAFT_736288 [Exidia glandulosa HHB12029]|uniref:Uncharacterized protein n=1 Tax=Exidia glandulosa HHB12029 TaxID=1314781 RepID=A0A165JI11_EXIGL|nr:hypothetical protein EXIGLDRAFT_736288 [Exidia glandulosa HHB12029]